MNEEIPAGEQLPEEVKLQLATCQNDKRLAVTTGPGGEPLCMPCAVKLAREINRMRKQVARRSRLAGCSPTIRSRNAK